MGSAPSHVGDQFDQAALPPQNIEPFDPNAWGDELEGTTSAQEGPALAEAASSSHASQTVKLPQFRELPVVATAEEALCGGAPCGPNPFRAVSQRSVHSTERSVTFQEVVEGDASTPSRNSSSRLGDISTQKHKQSKAMRIGRPQSADGAPPCPPDEDGGEER